MACLNEVPSSLACENLDSNVHIFRNKAGELLSWAWVFATVQSKKFVTTVDVPFDDDEHDDWKVVSQSPAEESDKTFATSRYEK